MRNPARTAATAAALMIGLALVTMVATLGKGLVSSDRQALQHQVRADYVVTSKNGWDPFSRAAGNAVAAAPGVTGGVERAERAGEGAGRRGPRGRDRRRPRSPRSTATTGCRARTRRSPGSVATARSSGRSGRTSTTSRSATGSRSSTRPARKSSYVVRGIFTQPKFGSIDPVLGSIAISQQAFDAVVRAAPERLHVRERAGRGEPGGDGGAGAVAGRLPGREGRDPARLGRERAKGVNQLLNLLYVLLALSVVVSLFGMVNTLVLSVFERTRELGMLRAVGMTRRQVRRMIRQESVVTALIGAALGLPLGLVPGRADHPGAVRPGRRLRDPRQAARRVRGRRDLGRHPRRDRPGPARLAAEGAARRSSTSSGHRAETRGPSARAALGFTGLAAPAAVRPRA